MKRTTALLMLGTLCLGLGFEFLNPWAAIAFSIVLASLAWKDAQ